MKKRRDFIQLAILTVLGLAVVFTLVLPELQAIQPQQTTVEISLFLQEGDMAFTSNTRLGMERAALEYGAELRFVTPPTDETHDNQMSLIQREIEGGADILIISPIDAAQLGEENINLPFLTVESEVAGNALTIAPDNSAIGVQLAEAVLADNPDGTILLIDSAGGRTGVSLRMEACTAYLKAAGATVVPCTLAELTSATTLNGIAAMVSLDYQTTLSLSNWASGQPIHYRLYGVGGTTDIAAYLERGTLQATVTWSEYAMGYLTVQRAVEAATGYALDVVPSPTILTIRGDSIYDPDNQKLLFPVV